MNTLIPSKQPLLNRIVRLDEMVPCATAFIDARTPGSDRKENFCLIGQGVAENPDQVVHIDIPHGFNVGAAKQPKGCKNSHHSHDTEEVFMIFSGEWEFTWGENGEDGKTVLKTGDTISLPRYMFRGFENIGTEDALMFSILGLDESGTAGHVLWAPYVFEQAKNHGLVLLEDGRLIDTAAGKSIPSNGKEQQATTAKQVASLRTLSDSDMEKCVATQEELETLPIGGLSFIDGVIEIAVIGPENQHEKISAGKMNWKHGFHLRRLLLSPGAHIPLHSRSEEEVIIVQSGTLDIGVEQFKTTLNAGDLFSIPINSIRELQNTSDNATDVMVIRRSDAPAAVQFLSKQSTSHS